MIGNPPTSNDSLLRDDRLVSLDALRGFDMFWIMGGEGIVNAAAALTGWSWLVWLSGQLEHPEWKDYNFALDVFAKTGFVPWVLSEGMPNADLFIGLSSTRVLPIHAAFRRRKSFLWKPRGFFR